MAVRPWMAEQEVQSKAANLAAAAARPVRAFSVAVDGTADDSTPAADSSEPEHEEKGTSQPSSASPSSAPGGETNLDPEDTTGDVSETDEHDLKDPTAKGTAAGSAKADEEGEEDYVEDMKPSEVIAELDRHIVGQVDAKRAVAIALRNRWRRQRLPEAMRREIVPRNMLMIGPTGCGKTEIARRLSQLMDAPFIKVEATKFTEVGFHGRDVDTIVRDLVEQGIALTKKTRKRRLKEQVTQVVETKILEALMGKESVRSNEHMSYVALVNA